MELSLPNKPPPQFLSLAASAMAGDAILEAGIASRFPIFRRPIILCAPEEEIFFCFPLSP